ncbi:MAG: PAS domain-containing protein [Paracoccus sp. (in: a-proteobacteria)]
MSNVTRKHLGDMQAQDIVGEFRQTTLTHYDGNTRHILYTDIETPFPDGKLIVSVTDADGYITHANDAFVYMSGYSKEELIGLPHYVLRHPDMPPIAFKGLWDELASSGRWKGYVKNLRKDGGYYWVYASVIANIREGQLKGYTSVRRRPSQTRVNECTALYKTLF